MVCSGPGDLEAISVPSEERNRPSLTEPLILELAVIAKRIEDHYRHPQDIEWAVDGQGKLYILQTRPLKVFEAKPARENERGKNRSDPTSHFIGHRGPGGSGGGDRSGGGGPPG